MRDCRWKRRAIFFETSIATTIVAISRPRRSIIVAFVRVVIVTIG